MTVPHPASPDVELVLTSWARALLTGDKFGTEAPADLADVLPWHRFTKLPSSTIEPTLERAIVEVDSFGANRAAASQAALRLQDAFLYDLPGSYFPEQGAAIGLVEVTSTAAWLPWDNTSVRRYGSRYAVVVHAVPIPA